MDEAMAWMPKYGEWSAILHELLKKEMKSSIGLPRAQRHCNSVEQQEEATSLQDLDVKMIKDNLNGCLSPLLNNEPSLHGPYFELGFPSSRRFPPTLSHLVLFNSCQRSLTWSTLSKHVWKNLFSHMEVWNPTPIWSSFILRGFLFSNHARNGSPTHFIHLLHKINKI